MKGGLTAILGPCGRSRGRGRSQGNGAGAERGGEEDGGLGLRGDRTGAQGGCGDRLRADRDAVVPAHAGVTLFRITVSGRAAHGAFVRRSERFEKFLPRPRPRSRGAGTDRNRRLRHPLYERGGAPLALSIGIVQAGIWPAIVPERLVAEGRIGVALGERIEDVRRQVEEAVRRAASADPWLTQHPPTVEWVGGVCRARKPPPPTPWSRR